MPDEKQNTKLHDDAERGDREAILQAIASGAKRDATNAHGQTPADLAKDPVLKALLNSSSPPETESNVGTSNPNSFVSLAQKPRQGFPLPPLKPSTF